MDDTHSNSLVECIFCNKCGDETKHVCEGDHHRDFPNLNDDGSLGFVERLSYRLWICAGCETGTLGEHYVFDITDENCTEEQKFFPERTKFHAKGKRFKQLPTRLATIYQESLQAYNNGQAVLCSLGIRALLEGICIDKTIVGHSLETKIDNMTGLLPQNIVTHLHSIRFIGNEAAHELAAPATDELGLAIEICEDLLNYLYELDYKASQLTSSHQVRRTTAKVNGDGTV